MAFKLNPTSILGAICSSKRRSRQEVISEFHKVLEIHASMISSLLVERRGLIDYESSRYPCSNYDNDLTSKGRVTINELVLNSNHLHRFLICRIISGSFQMSAVMTLIEDPDSSVERLALRNWSDRESTNARNFAYRSCIPIGTILAIRNPTYEMAADGHTLICCDNPVDIVVLRNHHPVLHSLVWKCAPMENNGLKVSSSFKKFALRPEQFGNGLGIPNNLMLTPLGKTAVSRFDRKEGKKRKRRDKKHWYRIIRRHSIRTLNRDNNVILVCCFIFFVWYLFFTNAI